MQQNDGGMGGRTGPYWRRQLGIDPRPLPGSHQQRGQAQLLQQAQPVQGRSAVGEGVLDPAIMAILTNHLAGSAMAKRQAIPTNHEDLAQLLMGQHGSVNDAYHALMQKRVAPTHSFLAPAVQRRQASRQVLQNALLSQLMHAQAQAHTMPAVQQSPYGGVQQTPDMSAF